jgi:uncharacterized membrane protein YfcA
MAAYALYITIFLSSFILTMVGLGGGLIFAPLLVLLEYPLATAVSVSLFLNGIAAFSASINYFRSKMVDVRTGMPLIVASTLSAPLGALMTHHIDVRLFTTVLAAVILLAAGRMLFSKTAPRPHGEPISAARRVIGGGFIGLVVGFIAGLLGIGGGVFIVPLLIYLLKLPTKTAAATSMFIVVFSSFSGFITHLSLSVLDWKFIGIAALFSFAGGQAGSRLMTEKLKGRTVRIIFGLVLLAFSAKLIQKAFV